MFQLNPHLIYKIVFSNDCVANFDKKCKQSTVV